MNQLWVQLNALDLSEKSRILPLVELLQTVKGKEIVFNILIKFYSKNFNRNHFIPKIIPVILPF